MSFSKFPKDSKDSNLFLNSLNWLYYESENYRYY